MKILDIGANDGSYAVRLCDGNRNEVVAVEPNPTFMGRDFGNLKIRWEGVAVSSEEQESVPMHMAGWNVLNTLNPGWLQMGRFAGHGTGHTINVRTTTVDRLVEKYGGFDHIKVDVEGYEDRVMMGVGRNHCPLQFEWAAEWVDRVTVAAVERLHSVGYTKWQWLDGHPSHDFTPWELPSAFVLKDELIGRLREIARSNPGAWGMVLAR